MRIFNAFQLVGAFVGWPFFIAWLSNAQFQGHQAAFVTAIVFYFVAFCFMVAVVADYLKDA